MAIRYSAPVREPDPNMLTITYQAVTNLASAPVQNQPTRRYASPSDVGIVAVVTVVVIALLIGIVGITAAAGAPTTQTECEPVSYWADPRLAPAGGLEVVEAAIARVRAATGVRFERAPDPGAATLTIGWFAPDGSENFAADPQRVGFTSANWRHSRGRRSIDEARVELNIAKHLAPGFGERTWGRAVLHELGHVMGLGHSDEVNSVMYPEIDGSADIWSSHETDQLQALAVEYGCIQTR